MEKRISILGSTGSIGTQTLEVIRKQNWQVTALTAKSNIKLLEEQIREFKPVIACVEDEKLANELKIKIADTQTKVVFGLDGLCECASEASSNIVLNSVVGMVGLKPTIDAIKAGKTIALANKETLVSGGKLVMELAKEKGVSILPVDSEHSAIFQVLQGMNSKKEVKRLILTASGGPFFGMSYEDTLSVTPAQALKHPNWSMGRKITIDSSTMINKGLELIEARWLFDVEPENIDVVVHRESIIHSLVEYVDNSVLAQLGVPDMRIPIQYAITYPDRIPSPVKQLNLADCAKLTFFEPDDETFEGISICREAIKKGGLYPATVNGANEKAVELFLENKISFRDIYKLIRQAMDATKNIENYTLEDVLEADKIARKFVEDLAE